MAVLPPMGFGSEGNVTLLLHTFLYLGLTFEPCGRVCGGSSWLLVDAGESSPPWAWVYENITNQEPESQQAPFFCDFCFEFCPDIPQWWAVTRKPKPANHSLYNFLLLIVFLTATKWNRNVPQQPINQVIFQIYCGISMRLPQTFPFQLH